MDSYLFGLMFR